MAFSIKSFIKTDVKVTLPWQQLRFQVTATTTDDMTCYTLEDIVNLQFVCYVKSVPNGHMHCWTYSRVNARVHEKVLVLFQE